jgi:hypothetical protein
MKVILEWNGDREDLMDEVDNKFGEDTTLVDDIMWLLDYGDEYTTIMHNDIKMRKEEDEARN